ncbi:MAG: ATP synthase F0 subunit B [Acidobacteriia bacterium]|nr:ATP synthase F0 subunit B [Terriglobia bacterium]
MSRVKRLVAPAFIAMLLLAGAAVAQPKPAENPAQAKSEPAAKPQEPAREKSAQPETPGQELTEASERAAGEGEENAEFKQSASVRFLAKITGLSLRSAYWLAILINFAVIAALVIWFARSSLPGMFRSRTQAIRKTMEEAQRTSADASRRLGEIESRLAKLDSEIVAMRAQAEADAAAEERRIKAAADEEARKLVESAGQEVEAASRLARRELKAYAAELAVSLAEQRIQVDAKTDQALVDSFVGQLGRDGKEGK